MTARRHWRTLPSFKERMMRRLVSLLRLMTTLLGSIGCLEKETEEEDREIFR